jgi:hypothetical protein
MIIFLNLTIAILSETYNRMTTTRLGLYYDGLIAFLPAYEHDEKYGILILIPPPFNVLTILFMPFCLYFRNNSEKLKVFNVIAQTIVYSPLALCFSVFFMVSNLLFLPFAYLKALLYKINCKKCCIKKKAKHVNQILQKEEHDDRTMCILIIDFIFFLLFGPVLLVLSSIRDLYYFEKELFTTNVRRLSDTRYVY